MNVHDVLVLVIGGIITIVAVCWVGAIMLALVKSDLRAGPTQYETFVRLREIEAKNPPPPMWSVTTYGTPKRKTERRDTPKSTVNQETGVSDEPGTSAER